MNRPYAESLFRFQFPHWQKARAVPFRGRELISTQDVGSKENTELGRGTKPTAGESYLSNPLDTVSLLEIGSFFRGFSR